MARLDTPTATDIPGPWLVEGNHLLALDDIYESYLSRLREDQEALIQEEIDRRMKEYVPQNASADSVTRARESFTKLVRNSRSIAGQERRITVYLRGGRTLQTEDFSEVINHAATSNEVPLGFRSSLTVEPVRIVVQLVDGDLSIKITPNVNPISQEVYGALLNWVSDIQPPLWLQKWLKYRLLILMFVPFFIAVALGAGATRSQQSANSYFKEEAHKILRDGVTPANSPTLLSCYSQSCRNTENRVASLRD
jgi:hypothetical protein